MDGLGERVFTLLSSVNHFYWTFCSKAAREREVSDAKGNSSTKASVFITRPVLSDWFDSPSIIQSRKQSQRPLKKDDFYFQILSWTVKKKAQTKERIKGRRKRPGAGATTTELTDYGAIPIPPTSLSFFQDRSNRTSGHWGEEWFGSKQLLSFSLSLRPSFDLSEDIPTSSSCGQNQRKNRGDAFLIGHWLSIPGVFLSGTLSWTSTALSGQNPSRSWKRWRERGANSHYHIVRWASVAPLCERGERPKEVRLSWKTTRLRVGTSRM